MYILALTARFPIPFDTTHNVHIVCVCVCLRVLVLVLVRTIDSDRGDNDDDDDDDDGGGRNRAEHCANLWREFQCDTHAKMLLLSGVQFNVAVSSRSMCQLQVHRRNTHARRQHKINCESFAPV